MNWYDYSWTDPAALAEAFPDWEERLRTKRFTRGRHNDGRFVRWSHDDRSFTAEIVATFERQLSAATGPIIVVTHHPPIRALNFPRTGPPTPDGLLWEAFSGNRAIEVAIEQSAARVPFVFCGHTHRARAETYNGILGYNVGSDYPFKRLLTLDWPAGNVRKTTFDVR